MYLSRCVQIFQKNVLPLSSEFQMVGRKGGKSSFTLKMEATSSCEMFICVCNTPGDHNPNALVCFVAGRCIIWWRSPVDTLSWSWCTAFGLINVAQFVTFLLLMIFCAEIKWYFRCKGFPCQEMIRNASSENFACFQHIMY
jgi:hypothetical protein